MFPGKQETSNAIIRTTAESLKTTDLVFIGKGYYPIYKRSGISGS
jgi:hypothetical protein